jgi:PHP family Zn ribbon phosphoesterase
MSGTYNKTSCRACGSAFSATKTCEHCNEPVKWLCAKCGRVDDSAHVHPARIARAAGTC